MDNSPTHELTKLVQGNLKKKILLLLNSQLIKMFTLKNALTFKIVTQKRGIIDFKSETNFKNKNNVRKYLNSSLTLNMKIDNYPIN